MINFHNRLYVAAQSTTCSCVIHATGPAEACLPNQDVEKRCRPCQNARVFRNLSGRSAKNLIFLTIYASSDLAEVLRCMYTSEESLPVAQITMSRDRALLVEVYHRFAHGLPLCQLLSRPLTGFLVGWGVWVIEPPYRDRPVLRDLSRSRRLIS